MVAVTVGWEYVGSLVVEYREELVVVGGKFGSRVDVLLGLQRGANIF
jgi:hypothetical protein